MNVSSESNTVGRIRGSTESGGTDRESFPSNTMASTSTSTMTTSGSSSRGPSFTAQDEAREAAALSPFERIEAECDLRGISPSEAAANVFASGRNVFMSGGEEDYAVGESMSRRAEHQSRQPAAMIRQAIAEVVRRQRKNVDEVERHGHEDASVEELLRQLDRELRSIPDGEKAPYQQAIERRCPDAVGTGGRSRRIAMLRYCDNDPRLAAKRLVEYWEERLRAFGEPRCYLPMALHGIMRDEVASMLERSSHHVLPGHDRAGRNVLVFDLSSSLINEAVRSDTSELKKLWYMLECLQDYHSSEPSRGTVFIINCEGTREASFLPLAALNQALFMLEVFPITLRAVHYIHPSAFTLREVLPVIKLDIGKELRQRLVVHIEDITNDDDGDGNEGVLESLASYGLPRAMMKDAIGGQHPDRKAWVHQRLAHEYAVAYQGSLGHPISQSSSNTSPLPHRSHQILSRAPRTTSSGSQSHKTGTSFSLDEPGSTHNNDVALALEIIDEKSGRAGDERMSRAIKAKIQSPGMSSYNALTAGGFVFPTVKRGVRSADIYDSDNVSLQQRKNQLSRRLRQVRDAVAVKGSGGNK